MKHIHHISNTTTPQKASFWCSLVAPTVSAKAPDAITYNLAMQDKGC